MGGWQNPLLAQRLPQLTTNKLADPYNESLTGQHSHDLTSPDKGGWHSQAKINIRRPNEAVKGKKKKHTISQEEM